MAETEQELNKIEDFDAHMKQLTNEVNELYNFRDLFFETHPIEEASQKDKLIEEKISILAEKFNEIDENEVHLERRAEFLYVKGRLYNICSKYDPRATKCLSKAVKLNPRFVDAWNELGECYWKNMNIKDAKSSFEGALKQERNRIALRCLSIILRQESTHALPQVDNKEVIERSVELAKEAVSQDPKDGLSWTVLGNAHLCKYFLVAQEPTTLKSCMGAYKQSEQDPIARGRPDLYNNYGVALKYDEQYEEALKSFERASKLDPEWDVPSSERRKLSDYLDKVNQLVRTKGKVKAKKLQQMVQAIDKKMLGHYAESMCLMHVQLSHLSEGENPAVVVLGKVVGSVHSENLVPFTFGLVDDSSECHVVTVYNWADGRGVIIGDTVALPKPTLWTQTIKVDDKEYKFKSIRINNPMLLLVNGKRIGRNQFAGARLTSTYELR